MANGDVIKGVDSRNSTAVKAAAMQSMVASNDVKGMNDLWNSSKNWTGESGDKLRGSLADSLQGASGKPGYFSQGAIAGLRLNGHDNTTKTIEAAIKANAYSGAKIASADKDELNVVADIAVNSATLSTSEKQQLINNANDALTDPELSKIIGKNKDNVINIRNHTQPPTPLP